MIRKMQGHHRIVESEEGRYLARKLRDPNIGTLFNLLYGSKMIVRWVKKDSFVFTEVGVIPPNSSGSDSQREMHRILTINSPGAIRVQKEVVEKCRKDDRDGTFDAQEEADRHIEIVEYLRKKAHVAYQDHPLWSTL